MKNSKLNKSNIIKSIKKHLTNYKCKSLNIPDEESGYWEGKKYSHILPEGQENKNLIDVSFKEELNDLFNKIKIHDGFAHLNSSQALCFNLFKPLDVTKNLSILFDEISNSAEAYFEYIEPNSFEKEGKTNFDFFIKDVNKKFFFEVKYTEPEFGPAKNDNEHSKNKHNKKYDDYYKQQLEKITKEQIDKKDFFANYQLWRNICHADIGNVCFVFLKERTDLEDKINEAIEKCKDIYQNKIRIRYIEAIVDNALKINDEQIKKHYEEFKKKYLNF